MLTWPPTPIYNENEHNSSIPNDSCFMARSNRIVTSRHRHINGPFINVGMPKMGSTSLHKYFCCGNYTSSHWECGKGKGLCADCMKDAVLTGSLPLKSCGNFQSFMQMDRDVFFPQIELLDQIHQESPNATFILMFRGMNDWFRSLYHWKASNISRHTFRDSRGKSFSERLTNANITGLPPGKGSNEREMSEFFCQHVNHIRKFVSSHPSHVLIELDIASPYVGVELEIIFGISQRCWGEANKNPALHDEKSDKVPNVCL
ncbi:hypothetical protein HJC23_002720 [Cyclotella cryptica]|uniref:Sulfotransferase domain-containing protein n=1 Tax=Cyclotella cryptica TaxID=29204 RepID=A0ABD3PFP9_9STRA